MSRIFVLLALTISVWALGGCAVSRETKADGTSKASIEFLNSPAYQQGYSYQRGYQIVGHGRGRSVYTPPDGYIHGLDDQWTKPSIVVYNGVATLVCWPGQRNLPVQNGGCREKIR